MADTTALKNRIRAAIKSNDNQEITGPVLQQALLDIVDELNGATETEASARQSGDSTLSGMINSEAGQRQNADTALGQRITEESQQRQNADTALGQRITNEIGQERQRAEEAFNDLDMTNAAGSQVLPEAINLTLRKNDGPDQDPEWRTLCQLLIPSATNQRAGLMSAAMRNLLYNLRNAGYAFGGIAVPGTNPNPISANCFYIVRGAGTYMYFKDADNESIILEYDGIYVFTYDSIENNYWEYNLIIKIDANPTDGSRNLVDSDGILQAIESNTLMSISYAQIENRLLGTDGAAREVQGPWAITDYIDISNIDSLKIKASQFPDSPYVSVQLYDENKQNPYNYIDVSTSINIETNGYKWMRVGYRFGDDNFLFIYKVYAAGELEKRISDIESDISDVESDISDLESDISEIGPEIGPLKANIFNLKKILDVEEPNIFSRSVRGDSPVQFQVRTGDLVFICYSGAVVGQSLAIALGNSSSATQYIIPGNGYALYKSYEGSIIANQNTDYLHLYNPTLYDVEATVMVVSQSAVINNILAKTEQLEQLTTSEQLVDEQIIDGKVILQDGTVSGLSAAWGVTELIAVSAGDKYKIFANQYPDSPYVGIQVLNQSQQVVQNYIVGINLASDEETVIDIENDGYLRIGIRISTGYEHYIKHVVPLKEIVDEVVKRKKKISKNINFVGMSIWWYDGRQLAPGHAGGVIANGYQTLLKKQFIFLSDTGNNYCYSGNSLGAISADDSYCIMNHSSAWQFSDNAIWTLDSITNDFKRNIPIGTYADYSNKTGLLTYYGALREFKDKVIALSGEGAIIICSNALRRNNSGYTSTSQNTNGDTLTDFEHALADVASREGWYFIDQFRLCGVTDDSIDLTTIDGLHLNNFGYMLAVKPWIEQFEIIRNELLLN